MKWNNFKESEKEYPEELIKKSLAGFSDATQNLLEIAVKPLSEYVSRNLGSFEFNLLLLSHNMDSYRFEIFKFGYDVELYPVKIKLENSLSEEVVGKSADLFDHIKIDDEKKLEEFLVKVFESKRFNEIVSGLMKLSKKNTKEKKW